MQPCSGPSLDETDHEELDALAYQTIPGKTIDSRKLVSFLRVRFGAGSYDMHMMQDSYRVIAPRKLSMVSDVCQSR
ncbi:hypothetical protein PMIN01_06549 [Paraphaeosphaeria minitans]|uniref:Uncharacterized protein n=1 Tax=Paraphaeosphaeria minitans TaxID=565426 RepID=A0A9P6KR19_9PLEO|nr:hypothetical protein PMIN01_06549 [Paraphaeosphaeria minitans]